MFKKEELILRPLILWVQNLQLTRASFLRYCNIITYSASLSWYEVQVFSRLSAAYIANVCGKVERLFKRRFKIIAFIKKNHIIHMMGSIIMVRQGIAVEASSSFSRQRRGRGGLPSLFHSTENRIIIGSSIRSIVSSGRRQYSTCTPQQQQRLLSAAFSSSRSIYIIAD